MATSPSDDDLELYVKRFENRINCESEPKYVQNYQLAQLYLSQGLFEKSLSCLEDAMREIRVHRLEYTWGQLFLSIGGLLASHLDYFGKYDEAEVIYCELLNENPDGDYICDYAIFLHKRKKDYEKAQW
jgi:tetratricopeptide (TPR) repeat protein